MVFYEAKFFFQKPRCTDLILNKKKTFKKKIFVVGDMKPQNYFFIPWLCGLVIFIIFSSKKNS